MSKTAQKRLGSSHHHSALRVWSAKEGPQSQMLTWTLPKNFTWTIRGHDWVKRGLEANWARSVTPKFRQNLCHARSLWCFLRTWPSERYPCAFLWILVRIRGPSSRQWECRELWRGKPVAIPKTATCSECTAVAAMRLRMRMRMPTRLENSLANFGHQISTKSCELSAGN